MNVIRTDIPDILVFEPNVFHDQRGWFMESFSEKVFFEALKENGFKDQPVFVQDNHSCSRKGVLRGLHYQLPPYEQGKLVRVVAGCAYDVVVDVRKDSSTFGKWVAVELSDENKRVLWIPAGFAHGFVATENDTHCLYKTTSHYHQASERVIRWNDPDLAIAWPIKDVCVSTKDDSALSFKDACLELSLVANKF